MAQRALVIGAGGAVGEAVALALRGDGWAVVAGMRTPRPDAAARLTAAGAAIRKVDLDTQDWSAAAAGCDALIFTTHLALTSKAAQHVSAGVRIVAFSSNNVAIDPEAAVYHELALAERTLQARHANAAIIRPTLIYGDPRLPTVTRLLRMARTWPLLPLPGSGRARVQPVFHEDLGRLAAGLASGDEGGVYAAGGPETVTMRALFDAALSVTGGRGTVISVPAPVLTIASPLLALAGFSADQAARAEKDRSAVLQTPLPPTLAPQTDVRTGLARHWAAMR